MSVDFGIILSEVMGSIKTQMANRGYRASNELRSAELEVLKGSRSGRVYKMTGTYGKKPSKSTKKLMPEYKHKLRNGQLYQASAPGEPPAVRSGTFRRSWQPETKICAGGAGFSVTSSIESHLQVGTKNKYLLGDFLEDGTGKMAPRPYKEKIQEKALDGIVRIYEEPYF